LTAFGRALKDDPGIKWALHSDTTIKVTDAITVEFLAVSLDLANKGALAIIVLSIVIKTNNHTENAAHV
jgi:hypothetical protein